MDIETYKKLKQKAQKLEFLLNGGAGSGNFGHSGRPGKVGGSGKGKGSLLEKYAKTDTWGQFRARTRENEFLQDAKANGVSTYEQLWQVWAAAKDREFHDSDIKELTKDEAINIVKRKLNDIHPNMWFVNADSNYKPLIVNRILENKDLRNAGLNVAYQNYKEVEESPISFHEFVNREQDMYRGHHGQQKIAADWFDSYTPKREYAELFGDQIETIRMKPKDTLGSYTTNAESEYLVLTKLHKNMAIEKMLNGGPGSGNFGHAGRPGKVGGSSKDSFSSPMRKKGFMEGDIVEITTDDGKKIQGEYKMSARVSSGVRLATIKGEDGQIYTVPFRSDRVKMIRNYDAPDTTPAQRRTKKQKEALSEVFDILKADEKMQKYMLNNCGEDTAIALRDELKKAQEDGVDFSNIKLERITSGRNRAQVRTAIWGSYDGVRTNYRADVSLMVSPGLVAGGKNYEASLKREYDNGEKNTDTIASVFRHEIGHIRASNLVARLTNNNYNTSDYDRVNRLVTDKALKATGLNFYDAEKKISRYATDNRSEMLAESFANPSKSNLTKAVVDAYNSFTQEDWGHTMNNVRKTELIREFDLCTGIPVNETRIDIIEE